MLLPVYIVLLLVCDGGRSWPAAIVFGVAGVTDQIDGYLARRWHVESAFGKFADPLADRLMIDAAVLLLLHAGRLPWAALLIPLRDLVVLVGTPIVLGRGYEFQVNLIGKAATWLLYCSLGFVMVTHEATTWPLWIFWTGFALALVSLGEYAHRKAAQRGARLKAVVMAGGEGTRLRPLTSNQPKPMVPIVGKPCMEHILELLREHGFTDVVVTVAFMPQAIRSYFGNGESLGLNIEYSVEESPLGTAGSVRHASDRLDETCLVISGDALCDFDLGKIVEFHKEKGAAVTIGLKSVENPLEFGIVVTDEDGRVERFLEKPSWGQVFSDTINTGIYVLEPEVLRHIPTDRPFDFSKELFPLLLEMGRPIYGYVCDGYWQDIGNLDQYRQANFDALDEKVALNISGLKIRGDVWVGAGVEIDDVEGVEGPAFIGNYCTISPESSVGPYSVLGPGTTLRERGRVAHSVIDASCYIGRSALVEGAILGRNCDVRCARARARGCRDRRPGDARRPVRRSIPGVRIYPYKEVESGRADPRERDLGVARHDARVRQGRRARPRQRRPDARGCDPVRRRARHGAEARRACRREPRERARVPDDQARDHLRPALDGRRGGRPAHVARAGGQASPEDAGLRRGVSRRRGLARSRGGADPPVRAARGSRSRRRSRRRSRSTSPARSCGVSRSQPSAGSNTRLARARPTRATCSRG